MNFLIWIAYISLILGMFLIVWPYFQTWMLSKKASYNVLSMKEGRIKRRLRIINDPISKHIEHKLRLLFPSYSEEYLLIFYLISGLFAVVGFLISGRGLPVSIAIMFCLLMALLPYGGLLVKLRLIQVVASFEGDVMINELLANYSMSYNNMGEAIEKTAVSLVDYPTSQRLLMQLSTKLQRTGDREEIKKIVGYFKESIATSWATVLSMNIVMAIVDGVDVEVALQDLNKSIVDAKKVVEYRRRQNNEAIWMLKYVAPLSYAFTVWISIRYFGFSISKFISYQFYNSVGVMWFCIIFTLYMVGIYVAVFLTKKRMDI